jgi:DNA-binding NarL/FixJ family response regulator
MDMTMPELNGIDAALQLRRRLPKTEILIFTAHETDDLIRDAFEAGAKSFINKNEASSHLIEAIESLSRHKPFFTDKVSKVLFSKMVEPTGGSRGKGRSRGGLSQRERQIVHLICEGKGNKEVAEALGISVRTAETHRANILRKLSLDSIAGLVRYAIRNKLIEP